VWDLDDAGDGGSGAAVASGASEAPTAAPSVAAASGEGGEGLESAATRQAFVEELGELEVFLQQRLRELAANADSPTYAGLFASAPPAIQQVTSSVLKQQLAAVEAVQAALRAPQLSQLLVLRGSQRSVERLASSLRRKLDSAERALQQAADADERRKELLATMERTRLRLRAAIEAIKRLQARAEAALSELLEGRKVNIFGEINSL
jgi:molecular chaperone GrpE (heat shock protein)